MFGTSFVSSSSCQQNTLKTPNLMNRFVRWMKDDKVPQIAKISAVALGAVALIVVAFLSGYPTLVLGLAITAAVPLCIWMADELNNVNYEESRMHRKQLLRNDLDRNLNFIKDGLGDLKIDGKVFSYDDLPKFSPEAVRQIQYISNDMSLINLWETRIQPIHMDSPVMRGRTSDLNSIYQKDFIALRVHDRRQENKLVVLIVYVDTLGPINASEFDIRILKGIGCSSDPLPASGCPQGIIVQEILRGTHLRFTLALN